MTMLLYHSIKINIHSKYGYIFKKKKKLNFKGKSVLLSLIIFFCLSLCEKNLNYLLSILALPTSNRVILYFSYLRCR